MNITEVLVPSQAIAWLPWAVQYFFYIGSAYAAAILFCISLIFRDHTSHQWRSALVLVMAVSAIIGPIALTADLHQPGRSLHFFLHFTPWSWMSVGSLLLPAFSTLAVVSAWLYLRNDIAQLKQSRHLWVQRLSLLTLGQWQTTNKMMLAMALLTTLSGLTIALYTGAEIYTLSSRSLWHQAASPILWFVTAFMGAIGLAMLTLCMMPNANKTGCFTSMDRSLIKRSLLLSAILSLVLLPMWASSHAYQSLVTIDGWPVKFAALTLAFIGCIIVVFWLKGCKLTLSQKLLISVITLFSCWYFRWVSMMDVQTLPNYDVGPYPYSLPLDSTGLLGIVGVFGLWLAITALVTEVFATPITANASSNNRLQRGLNNG